MYKKSCIYIFTFQYGATSTQAKLKEKLNDT